jgi:acyl-CoA hydrolase
MDNYKLVLPEHLNHYGYLFGGHLLKWVDEVAWIAASLDHPGCKFVTIAMDKVEFRKSVRQGAILRFHVKPHAQGRTSVQYRAEVFTEDLDSAQEALVFSTTVSFVCLDSQGLKAMIPVKTGQVVDSA